ncbi:putative cupredoxin, phytocyanin [Helianthus annuus]|uniref:Cupredoxin, phytocyanin n=1 Tax=Helianthus annuus TaxID=4232 RepID=A0A9K3HEB1_HELAN|nr:putative cupredoxin, phytocyanin [Helianthus annuus]KAJ0488064.1 putative cupredoxin, phytocyanin [Helianthus annuus]KAJ0491415.1 putative cupredoxin, phytocyanin [Helianthus annuus]KAJ0503874.1 putative cupredoxin, phytocyanin [Helianthus annuus]KAJ0673561.1 putative cupredoxin, phytocyanin [Helianthus annuus]
MTSLKLNLVVVTTIVVAYLHFPTTMARNNWIVGGARGWIVPPNPNYYESWKKGKEFFTSDVYWLVFKNKSHDIIAVNKEASMHVTPTRTPTPRLSLKRGLGASVRYFICSHHCSKGHKIMIDLKESKEEW